MKFCRRSLKVVSTPALMILDLPIWLSYFSRMSLNGACAASMKRLFHLTEIHSVSI